MKRRLGAFEQAIRITDALAPFNVVCAARLASGPDVEQLRAAVDGIQRRHPMLQVRIARDGNDYRFDSEGVGRLPITVLERRSGDQWQAIVEQELNTAIDTNAGPLARLTYIHKHCEASAAELVLTFQHAIIDGISGARLVNELFAAWAGLPADDPAEIHPQHLPPPVEELFPPAYKGLGLRMRLIFFLARQTIDELRYRRQSRRARQAPIHPAGRCHILTIKISREQTAQLIRRARRQRVTINSALSAAMLMSVHRKLYHSQATALRHFVFVNLRPYLVPPQSPAALGCYFSPARVTCRLAVEDELWTLARALQEKISVSMRRGDKFINAVMSKLLMRLTIGLKAFRMGTTALSYTGPLRIKNAFGPIRLEALHFFISNNVLGPEYTAQASLFQGALCWNIVYLEPDMTRDTAVAIGEEIIDYLKAAAGLAPTAADKELNIC
jgi:NRPS condensation-like uncharacterized protein